MPSDAPALLPRPATLEMRDGEFLLRPETTIHAVGGEAAEVANLLAECLRPATGYPLPVKEGAPSGDGSILLEQTGHPVPDEAGFVDERYELLIESGGVRLAAPTDAGLARGMQALRQCLPAAIFASERQEATWSLPALRIEDAPRFRWRGLLLDVSRHFYTPDEVRRFIDLAALHRFNTVHLHLTDDQGWRVEIRKYPKLTEVGSQRPCTVIGHNNDRPRRYDGTPHGGFYTQDELRELVAFARRRRITLLPEIDMPGHTQAVVAAYPERGNTGNDVGLRWHWGISQHILNAEEETVRFMQDVLDEVMEIFPSRFIHVGGDEADKKEWNESARVQERMAELGLGSEEELQSWFIRRMDTYLQECGRRLVGWDEILEGGLAPGATVMSWRGEAGGIEAARLGHDVVMAPNPYVYFDWYQAEPIDEEPLTGGGLSTLGHVYGYEPVPESIPEEKRHHVLGGHGALWTEYIPDQDRLDYMSYPRACALAEVLWSPREGKAFPDFLERLGTHRRRLDTLGVKAHPRP